MLALTDFDVGGLSAQLGAWQFKPSHAGRVLKAFYDRHGEIDWSVLKLGKALEQTLRQCLRLRQANILHQHHSPDGTLKLLIGFDGGGAAEAVLMPSHRSDRAAGCISTQMGCAMGCSFCASTRDGLQRNLSAGEMVEQFLYLRSLAAGSGRRLATLVLMGMGEPLHNLENVIMAIRRIAAPGMGELGGRQITVSTVGIVPAMDELAEADLNVHLALSLHAPDDATRSLLVPMNRRYGVSAIMAAARRFQQRTGRVVNIEYCLIAGINDQSSHAVALADLMGGFRAHVNLIPYNPTAEAAGSMRRPDAQAVRSFWQVLRDRGVAAHVRRPRGDDIHAACGQLRGAFAGQPGPMPINSA
jgi:23S rRNA (adenine2503-C2)-methyltransferase